jgi:hypothetical protein
MDQVKFLYWTIALLFGFQLGACTYYMEKPVSADFEYPGNLIERDWNGK